MRRIGLLGGSFDPPHKGHIYISTETRKFLQINQIWWLVTPQNPMKISQPASYQERVKNCKEMTKNKPIIVNEVEKKINSKYTYQTLNYLLNHYTNIKFFWIMGADNLINFHKWQKWKQIFKEVSIVVFKRHGYNNKALRSIACKTFSSYQINTYHFNENQFNKLPSWSWIDNREIKISSTEIRQQRLLLRGKN